MSLYNYVPTKDHLVQLMIDQTAGEYAYPPSPPRDKRAAIADLARQGRDIAERHPWLPAVLHRPPPMGPLMYGGMQATLADERARTGVTAQEQAAAPVATLVSAAASGRYPNLAAALAAPAPPPAGADDIFESCVMRLIDGALAG
jgi:AcrR family transcriptional regulator